MKKGLTFKAETTPRSKREEKGAHPSRKPDVPFHSCEKQIGNLLEVPTSGSFCEVGCDTRLVPKKMHHYGIM